MAGVVYLSFSKVFHVTFWSAKKITKHDRNSLHHAKIIKNTLKERWVFASIVNTYAECCLSICLSIWTYVHIYPKIHIHYNYIYTLYGCVRMFLLIHNITDLDSVMAVAWDFKQHRKCEEVGHTTLLQSQR